MRTREEQRAEILRLMEEEKDFYKRLQWGDNIRIAQAWKIIRRAMEMKPQAIKTYFTDGGICAPNYEHHKAEYSKEDNRKVATILHRMDEQGYIKISQSGKFFQILKTK